jgi:PAS domain-containing protein
MTHKPVRFDQAALETILDALLSEHRDAFVAAIEPGPGGRFVPIPASLQLRGQSVLEARTALDLVVPEDRVVVISAWEQARATGASRATIRLAVAPDAAATIQYVDARSRHGVYVVAIVSDASASERLAQRVNVSPLPPRVGRSRKDEMAVIVEVDEALLRILGWTADEMLGHRSLESSTQTTRSRRSATGCSCSRHPGRCRPCGSAFGAPTAGGRGSRSRTTTSSRTRHPESSWPR